MKKRIWLAAGLMLLSMALPAQAADGTYFQNMQHALTRGIKNVLGAVLEIPVTIQEYHEQAGTPGVRHMAGFVDGTFQAISRMGSGMWDLLAAFLPGNQQGIPVTPETLF